MQEGKKIPCKFPRGWKKSFKNGIIISQNDFVKCVKMI